MSLKSQRFMAHALKLINTNKNELRHGCCKPINLQPQSLFTAILSHDIVPGSYITPYIKIGKILVVYRFLGNAMK